MLGRSAKQIESVQVMGKVFQNDLTKFLEDLIAELKVWFRKFSRFSETERPSDATGYLFISYDFLTRSVSTCTSEHSFSTLRRLKHICAIRVVNLNEQTCFVKHLQKLCTLSRRDYC